MAADIPPRDTHQNSASPIKSAFVPILLVLIGVLTLLGQYGVVPSFNQLWTIGLAAVGVLTFLLNGYNKSSFVIGSFLILSSGCRFFGPRRSWTSPRRFRSSLSHWAR